MLSTQLTSRVWKQFVRKSVRKIALAAAVAAVPVFSLVPATALGQSPDRVASRIERETDTSHPLIPAIRIAKSSLERMENVRDYEGTFVKRERVGQQFIVQPMTIKLREEPFSVYLRFHAPHDGREVMYIEGWNDGKMIAHDVGIRAVAGTVSLDPNSARALSESRHPITKIGMRNLLKALLVQWESETEISGVQVQYFPNAKIGDTPCKVVESRHERPQPGVKFAVTRLFLDAEKGLPIRVQQYEFPETAGGEPQLVEEYSYLDMKYNVDLDSQDFDYRNPEYGF